MDPEVTDQRIRIDVTMCPAHRSSEVRCTAAETLGKLGKWAAPAVPTLTECLKDKTERVRRVASEALARSRGEAEQAIAAEPRSLALEGAQRRQI